MAGEVLLSIRYDVFRGDEVVGSTPTGKAALAIQRLFGEGRIVASASGRQAELLVFSPDSWMTEVFGRPNKTVLGLHIMEAAQKAGAVAVIVDSEQALDAEALRVLGIEARET